MFLLSRVQSYFICLSVELRLCEYEVSVCQSTEEGADRLSQPFFLSGVTLSFNEKRKKNTSQLKKDTVRGHTINITTMIPKVLFLAFLTVLIDY